MPLWRLETMKATRKGGHSQPDRDPGPGYLSERSKCGRGSIFEAVPASRGPNLQNL